MKEFGLDLIIQRLQILGTMEVTVMNKPYNQRSRQPSPTFCSFDFGTPRPWRGDKGSVGIIDNCFLILYQPS